MKKTKQAVAAAALLASLSCMAQDTVKAVLEAGGKRMTAEQLQQAVAGKRMTGKTQYEVSYVFGIGEGNVGNAFGESNSATLPRSRLRSAT